eukprot:8509616-Alexandrium_andersonii.AAC.1
MLQDYVSEPQASVASGSGGSEPAGGSVEPQGRPDATGIVQASVLDHKREAVAVAMEQAGGSAEPQGRPDATGIAQ